MNNNILGQVISFVFYVFIQVLFIRYWALADTALCFVYISFLMLLPRETNRLVFMLLAFGTGLIVDLFYDMAGIHASACVMMAYFRKYVLEWVEPSGGYEANMQPGLASMGLNWFGMYSFLLILVHHGVLFMVEASSFHLFYLTLLKIAGSSLFTFVTILLFQYLRTFKRNR